MLDPSLSTVAAHCVVNVLLPCLVLELKPLDGFFGCNVVWEESALIFCLGRFDFFAGAFDFCFPFGTPAVNVTLEVPSLCESRGTTVTSIDFGKFFNIFDKKSVPIIRTDGADVFHPRWRKTRQTPHNCFILLPLWFINPKPNPFGHRFSSVEMFFDASKVSESSAWDVSASKVVSCKKPSGVCTSVRPRTEINNDVAPQTKVIMEGVKSHHWTPAPLCLVAQPVLQWACAKQWLSIENNFEVCCAETLSRPFCVRPLNIIIIQTMPFLLFEPFRCVRFSVEPG